jgi:hypothetical protein
VPRRSHPGAASNSRLVLALSRRRFPGILGQQVVQPGTEAFKIPAQPVKLNVGLFQLVGRLLAGGEQLNQRPDKFVVRGDVGSFLGGGAFGDSRSGACSIRA